jgi:hypothetical protein
MLPDRCAKAVGAIVMITPLEKDLRRALKINGADYVLTISPKGLKLTLKRKRSGLELNWADLVNGEAALATALNASLGQPGAIPNETVTPKSRPARNGANAASQRLRKSQQS